ncbi:putative NBD/HSP70 family sugar kinase [Arthrobacter pigmenti]|uniref:Putative NBD/HSP70 family sugar kinase n=1 Tax=Arthrobacter pigmenti TaxID=271432 RepID=A0A846RQV7_9MICC|nr:ROK family transcriptional regulator [Arthrobacter pigmenti]NJC23940.1 putative NBD/HSP70 family sugar kinase [Arthrobacter pigmenti]
MRNLRTWGDSGSATAGDIFQLVRNGNAASRSALARITGLAPSTVSLRVDSLLDAGLLEESGDNEASRGGRRARELKVAGTFGLVAVADLGANHASIAIADFSGQIVASSESAVDTSMGPAATAQWLWAQFLTAIENLGRGPQDLRGIAIGIPAPIERSTGRTVRPATMPAWHNANLPQLLAQHTSVPVFVENDANLVALGEFASSGTETQHLLALKLGTRIGCGIIAEGQLYRGGGGAAGEISHNLIAGASKISCSCAAYPCLESAASGRALTAALQEAGYDVKNAGDVITLGHAGDTVATEALREAGVQIGRALSSIVNFLNPEEVVLGGSLAASPPLVAAVQAELFQLCLPLVTANLDVRASSLGTGAGVLGAVHLVLDELLLPQQVDLVLRNRNGEDQDVPEPATLLHAF